MNYQSHLLSYMSLFPKAALKHADSQGVIEKMEQEMARLKLKHSLEVKVSQELRIMLKQFHQYPVVELYYSTYYFSKFKLESDLDFILPSNGYRSNGNLVPRSRAF